MATGGVCGPGRDHQSEWDIKTGRNKDPKKQPKLGGVQVPTFDELKNRPGFSRYMVEGTYAEAVRDWAYKLCTSGGTIMEPFCSTAAAYGLLDQKNPAVGRAIILVAIGGVAGAAIRACAASALCPRIAAGALDATTPEGAAFAGATGGSVAAVRMLDNILDTGRQGGTAFWGSWSDYSKVSVDGREYADINGRLYTRHAVERMAPSGYGNAAGGVGGRSVSPTYVNAILGSNSTTRTATKGPNGEARVSHVSGSIDVITENDIVVTIITR